MPLYTRAFSSWFTFWVGRMRALGTRLKRSYYRLKGITPKLFFQLLKQDNEHERPLQVVGEWRNKTGPEGAEIEPSRWRQPVLSTFRSKKSKRFPHVIMLSLLCNKARGRGGNHVITGLAVREGTLIQGRTLPGRTCSKWKVTLNHSLINIYLFWKVCHFLFYLPQSLDSIALHFWIQSRRPFLMIYLSIYEGQLGQTGKRLR